MKAAEQRREEAEQSGDALQSTSCDSITQVQFSYILGACASFLHVTPS